MIEKPWAITTRHSSINPSCEPSGLDRWTQISAVLKRAAESTGQNANGDWPPVGDWLDSLSAVGCPDEVLNLGPFGCLDVVIVTGRGKKEKPHGSYCTSPIRMEDDRFKVIDRTCTGTINEMTAQSMPRLRKRKTSSPHKPSNSQAVSASLEVDELLMGMLNQGSRITGIGARYLAKTVETHRLSSTQSQQAVCYNPRKRRIPRNDSQQEPRVSDSEDPLTTSAPTKQVPSSSKPPPQKKLKIKSKLLTQKPGERLGTSLLEITKNGSKTPGRQVMGFQSMRLPPSPKPRDTSPVLNSSPLSSVKTEDLDLGVLQPPAFSSTTHDDDSQTRGLYRATASTKISDPPPYFRSGCIQSAKPSKDPAARATKTDRREVECLLSNPKDPELDPDAVHGHHRFGILQKPCEEYLKRRGILNTSSVFKTQRLSSLDAETLELPMKLWASKSMGGNDTRVLTEPRRRSERQSIARASLASLACEPKGNELLRADQCRSLNRSSDNDSVHSDQNEVEKHIIGQFGGRTVARRSLKGFPFAIPPLPAADESDSAVESTVKTSSSSTVRSAFMGPEQPSASNFVSLVKERGKEEQSPSPADRHFQRPPLSEGSEVTYAPDGLVRNVPAHLKGTFREEGILFSCRFIVS